MVTSIREQLHGAVSLPPASGVQIRAHHPAGAELRRARRQRRLVGTPGRLAACVIGLLMILVAHSVLAPEATAGGSELRFSSERPNRGAQIRLDYRDAQRFAKHDSLRVRARYRSARGVNYNNGPVFTHAAYLVRSGTDRFAGTLQLPDSVVYATFSVEDLSGGVVDHNGHRLWELIVHEHDTPTFSGLEQRFLELHGRNWELMRETASRMVKIFPDHPAAWHYHKFMEGQLARGRGVDSLKRFHAENSRRLHRLLESRPGLSVEAVWGMSVYAADPAVAAHWRRRLVAEFPRHYRGAFQREDELVRQLEADPALLLSEMEGVWADIQADAGPHHAFWFKNGVVFARLAKDPAAFLRWTDRVVRYDDLQPHSVAYYLRGLGEWSELHKTGIDRLQGEMARLARRPDSERPLDRSVLEQRRNTLQAAAEMRDALADLLLAVGDSSGAMRERAHVADAIWRVSVFRSLGRLHLAAGDTRSAILQAARIAVDPSTSAALADTIRSQLDIAPADVRWTAALARARTEMVRRTLAEGEPVQLREGIAVLSTSGRRETLWGLLNDGPGVVAYWSPTCAPSRRQLPELAKLSAGLRQQGIPLIAVAKGNQEELQNFLVRERVELETVADPGDVAAGLRNFGTPTYYVLDGVGRIWFRGSALSDVPRQLYAVSHVDLLEQPD